MVLWQNVENCIMAERREIMYVSSNTRYWKS